LADYRLLYDSEHLYAFHLQGRDVTLEISRVTGGEVTGDGGKKSRKPLVYFKGKEKPLALNRTNGKTIATLYGNDASQWVGKLVTIYPTTTKFGRDTVDCIRVRASVPRGKASPDMVKEDAAPPAEGNAQE
jgi:hypothetical protein